MTAKVGYRKGKQMNEVGIFKFETNEVRTVVMDNEVWFVGKDVADTLGYSNTRDALSKHVDQEDKNTVRNSRRYYKGEPKSSDYQRIRPVFINLIQQETKR